MTPRTFRALAVLYHTLTNDFQRAAFAACHRRVYQLLVAPPARQGYWSDRRREMTLAALQARPPLPADPADYDWRPPVPQPEVSSC